jgi:uncharacterized caspase-like protein
VNVPPARLLPALALVILLAGCAHGGLSPRGLEPARSTADELSRALEPRRVALVIGVSRYDDPAFPDLAYADDDAEAVAELLSSKAGGFDEVVLLAEPGQATRQEVLRRLRFATTDLGQEDVFVLYFSGHGTLSGADEPSLFLLPADAAPGDLATSALELDALRGYLARLPVQRKALVVDACFNGDGKSSVDPELLGRVDELLAQVDGSDPARLAGGEAHLFASSPGRPAFEDPDLKHGVYTHYLLQALSWARQAADLDADGLITAWEAHDYARGRAIDHTDGAQVPEAALRVVGRNDLAFVGDPAARTERDQALVFDYSGGLSPFAGAQLFIDGRPKGVFPGAVLVAPGAHKVEVRATDGRVLLDGYAKLEANRSIPVRELKVLSRQDKAMQALRFGGLFGARDSWGAIWGGGVLAVEAFGALRRARAPGEGFYLGGTFGVGVSPTRDGMAGLVQRGRGTFWLGIEPGWAGSHRRALFRLGWQLRATMVPVARLPGIAHATLPEEAGWVIFSTGPTAQLGVALGRNLSFVLALTVQTSPFAAADEPVKLHSFAVTSAGLEIAL